MHEQRETPERARTKEVRTKESQTAALIYRAEILVRFGYCDPAGMVFYPRYLEMFNNLVEDWCRDGLQFSFFELHKVAGHGLPTVHLEVDFIAPSFLGETLTATLAVLKVGTSSISLEIILSGADGARRVRGTVVLVLIDTQQVRPMAIPEDLRQRILAYCIGTDSASTAHAKES